MTGKELLEPLLFTALGFILGYFVVATFYFHSPQYFELTKGECIQKGFYDLDLIPQNIKLASDLNNCQARLAFVNFKYEKWLLDLNECRKICFDKERTCNG